MTNQTPIYSIKEMAELGGVSRRTVRYYVQRGLIPQPTGTGRGKHYTQAHLDALIRVRTRQEAGESLDAILAGETRPPAPRESPSAVRPPSPAYDQSTWVRIEATPDIEIHLRNRTLDPDIAAKLAEAVRQILDANGDKT